MRVSHEWSSSLEESTTQCTESHHLFHPLSHPPTDKHTHTDTLTNTTTQDADSRSDNGHTTDGHSTRMTLSHPRFSSHIAYTRQAGGQKRGRKD